jgi:peroxiredoxin
LDRGDAVPKDVWSALKDSQGNSLALSKLKAEGGELVLLVPEYAHHTGGPGETWTKLLIDLQNMLGSQPEKVRAVAVSPEPDTVHAKMISRYNLKLFSFASDSDRSFLAAHKVLFFVFLAFIRNPHVHTRTVMMAHARVHTGHTHTHALA